MKAIIIAPIFDSITIYSHDWATYLKKKIEPYFEQLDFIGGKEVDRSQIESLLKNYDFVIFFNHGTKDALWGSSEETVFNMRNVRLLKDKYCYTLACLSAKKLGKKAVEEGAIIYWGYTEPFSFTKYDNDLFCDFATYGLIRYLECGSWDTALKDTIEHGKKLTKRLLEKCNIVGAVLLEKNMSCLVCLKAEQTPKEKYIYKCIYKIKRWLRFSVRRKE